MDKPEYIDEPKCSDEPFAYEALSSSILPLVYDTVSDENAEENIILQGNPYYNLGCHGNGLLPTDDSEHEYQEADTVPQSTRPLLEVSVCALTIDHPWRHTGPTCNAVHALLYSITLQSIHASCHCHTVNASCHCHTANASCHCHTVNVSCHFDGTLMTV